MYLKKLEIQGFKSFADKITLSFSPGITAIVGPNGSGKSNIADAVRWVLGEQSAKVLRGSKMEDVIFAGTEHRKPIGFSEVSLTIDNSDKKLPIDYDEVVVTRRIFRSGESEYLINKTSCRLKDIYELFYDTGIGKDGYSIIGQGRIDEVLSSKSEDRRRVIEEASGIMKYKTRKEEAERKLEYTSQNLLRINDIIGELRLQLGPLEEQARNAKKYLALREELKINEINLYLINISRYKERLVETDKQLGDIKSNIEDCYKALSGKQSEKKRLAEKLAQLEESLSRAKESFYELEGKIEKAVSQIKVNDEKIKSNNENIVRIVNEIKDLENKAAALADERASKSERLQYLEDQHKKFSEKLESLQQQMDDLLSLLDESEKNLELKKQEMSADMDLLSDKKLQANNVNNHILSIEKRIEASQKEIFRIKLDIDRENLAKDELGDNLSKIRSKIGSITGELEKARKTREILLNALEEKRKFENQVRSDIQVKSSRKNMLRDMESKLEGYSRSVRQFLLSAERVPELKKGIHGAVAQLISVSKEYETAIEMVLGSSLQHIVTGTEEDAKKAIAYLKANDLGRATFLPISAVKCRKMDDNTLSKLKKARGFIGTASELITYDAVYANIFGNLLGRVIVVDNIDNAVELARQFDYNYRIVTLEGDIINPSGSMTGGSKESKGVSILGRQRIIDELDKEINDLKLRESQLGNEIREITENLNAIVLNIQELENELKENELIKMRDESQLIKINENLANYASRVEMIQQEIEQMQREKQGINEELVKYNNEIEELNKRILDAKAQIDEYQSKYHENRTARDELYNDISDHKVSINSIRENIDSISSMISRIESDSLSTIKSIEKKQSEKEKYEKQNEQLKEDNERLNKIIKGYEQEKAGRTFEMDRIVEEREVASRESEALESAVAEISENIMKLKEEQNRLEIRRAKTESEMEAVQNRLWDDYELTYNNALEYKKDLGGTGAIQKQIDALKEEISALGNVNVNAIEEYRKTRERCEFMEAQKNDMEKSIVNLKKVISEMTSLMKKQFSEQFEKINRNFNSVFRELFDGGHASLILEDAENILESGIEIKVQPPGKKLQNMMLLSGGERALTAIALLFAILKLNPTPFCILDEIEATLDDNNVYKFGEYLRNFSDDTQFILVTHRKGTMEVSDMLYGVTMEEHGVSKVISMKLEEQEAS